MAEAGSGEISARTIGKGLKKIGFTRKKLMATGKEMRKKDNNFGNIYRLTSQQTWFIQMNRGLITALDYGYGWNEKGSRFYDFKLGKRSIRVSITRYLCQGKLVAPLTFEGSCNRQVFETWLEEMLTPSLKLGQIVILDNGLFINQKRLHS